MNFDVMTIVVPGIVSVVGLFLRSRRGSSNHWDVLHELARGRADVARERERRDTLRVLNRLP